jgi:hypothetical protein
MRQFLISPTHPTCLTYLTFFGVRFPEGTGTYLLSTASKPALGPPPNSYPLNTGVLSLGVKWLVSEVDHTPQSSSKIKNAWNYTSTPPIRLHGEVLS